MPPPHIAKTVKRSIAKVENIKDHTRTSLFLTLHSKSPVGDSDKVAILNRNGPGSTPQEPLALVAKLSDSERRALESEGRVGLASEAVPLDTVTPEIQYRTSIPTLSYISFRNILTVEGSVLSALRRRL